MEKEERPQEKFTWQVIPSFVFFLYMAYRSPEVQRSFTDFQRMLP